MNNDISIAQCLLPNAYCLLPNAHCLMAYIVMPEPQDLQKRLSGWRMAGELSAIGLTLVFATVIGYFGGTWIGAKFGSKTWGGLIGAVMGITAGFIEMFRTVSRYLKAIEAEERRQKERAKGEGRKAKDEG